jgi:hypothetical protein
MGERACFDEREAVELLAERIVKDHLRGPARTRTKGVAPPDQGFAQGNVKVIRTKDIRSRL